MPLGLRDVVDHSPFPGTPFRWRMGVRNLAVENWLQIDDRRALDLLEKDLLSLRHPEQTFVARAGSEASAREVVDLVAESLAHHGHTLRTGARHPLDTAARSVQEDLCLLERDMGGDIPRWRLTAGSVCFPTRWDLRSKLGCTLTEIHAPVPGYAAQVGAHVDRFFDRMVPGALASRLNWSVVGEATRRLEPRDRQAPMVLPANPGTDLFVRIERQTLRRLVHHDAIVFGIRIHVWSLGQVAEDLPGSALAEMLDAMPLDVARYKDLDGLRGELAKWLRNRVE
ncbi:MAG: DUF3445 domain-containing protein [Acidimicrobiales bacterium]